MLKEYEYKLTVGELTDVLLALSATCGDITGRGSLLVDNDERALATIAETLVPGYLAGMDIEAEPCADGWLIRGSMDKGTLSDSVVSRLLHRLNPERGEQLPASDQSPGSPPPIRPHYY